MARNPCVNSLPACALRWIKLDAKAQRTQSSAKKMNENEISKYIVDAAIEVHRTLGGPGLLESVYEEALVFELRQAGIKVERQKPLPIIYKGTQLATPLRMDMVVADLVIVECKAVEGDHRLFEAQALTYLRLTGLKLALIINFNERLVKNGIRRIVNNL